MVVLVILSNQTTFLSFQLLFIISVLIALPMMTSSSTTLMLTPPRRPSEIHSAVRRAPLAKKKKKFMNADCLNVSCCTSARQTNYKTVAFPMPSSLRNRFELDVYQVVKKLEQSTNDGKLFKTVSAAYGAVKSSNSSLSRHKKKPLEDALFRVLDVRSKEQAQDESDDSEAAIDVDEPESTADERFLLNRQITKHWNVEPASMVRPAEKPAKKRRLAETDENDMNNMVTSDDPTTADTAAKTTAPKETSQDGSKSQKKASRTPLFNIVRPDGSQFVGFGEGYSRLLSILRSYLVEPPQWFHDEAENLKFSGILLTGPSGIGKRSHIDRLAWELNVPLINITESFDHPERAEKSIVEAFDVAVASTPCIISIDQIENYMPSSSEASQLDHQVRLLRCLKKQLLRIDVNRLPIVCMATAEAEGSVNSALFRERIFQKCIQLRLPGAKEREEILRKKLASKPLDDDVDIADILRRTHGYIPGDFQPLMRLAWINRRERFRSTHHSQSNGVYCSEEKLGDRGDNHPISAEEEALILNWTLNAADLSSALEEYVPLLRKEGFTAIPKVTWKQVGGLAAVRQQLELSIVGRILNPEAYRRFGLTRPSGCLLWGPPGCGKTLVAQAVANEAQASFILINGPELLNKYVGESERAVRELFARARSSKPCILFFDEFDSIVPRRDGAATEAGTRVVNALLTELDGASDRSDVYVIGTTNRPDMIDEAILRPGRLSVQLFLGLPSPSERVDILRATYRKLHEEMSETEMERLEAVALDPRCEGFSGADLDGLHTKAAETGLTRWMKAGDYQAPQEITTLDWEEALSVTKPSVSNPQQYSRLKAKLSGKK